MVTDQVERIRRLETLLSLVAPVPPEWLGKGALPGKPQPQGRTDIRPAPCHSWEQLCLAWAKALKWRRDLEDVLAVSLAVCLSTEQIGDQLFLMLVGPAGSAKTRICDALLVSKHCYPLEHLTGFHSGYKEDKDGEEDFSLLARINRKTLITPEGDVLMSSPRFAEIMSQQRRIFDGTSGASYKNRKQDMRYTGLRTPWIMAGTPVLLDTDQSRLGDRFLRVIIGDPDDEMRRDILRRVGHTALRSVRVTANGDPESCVEDRLLEAYKLTGGYVDYLRGDPSGLLASVRVEDEEGLINECSRLADFVAAFRARPSDDKKKKEGHDAAELPTRLTHQFVRLACCLAAVTQLRETDAEVMRIVRKVALDTAYGRIYRWVKGARLDEGEQPLGAKAESIANSYFLKRIGVLEDRVEGTCRLWQLTAKFRELWVEAHR